MRTLFICSSLDPGKDGVGDFTRRLALQLETKGHTIQLLSLCDVASCEETAGENIKIIRYANALNSRQQKNEIEAAITKWSPDVVSLQFVCFGFHPKGLIHSLIPLVGKISRIAPLHIMFHELWLGEQPDLPFKHKLLGQLQKRQMLSALRRWQPVCIHTSNELYQKVLGAESIVSRILPIFGNIPIQSATDDIENTKKPGVRKLIFPFSQRNDWNVRETMTRLQALAESSKLSFELIQVGRLRNDANHWSYIKDFCQNMDWACRMLGECDATELSRLLQSADIGICAVHPALADKSGAAVSMLEHGLPVICTITQAVSKRFSDSIDGHSQLFSFLENECKLLDLIKKPVKHAPRSRLPAIATQWEADLNICLHD